ncbi:MAG: alpha/beta hydrolase [Alphaproteobacteria bacterium]|nr:alpha/beta hydrolase [Alphaproteobacteria bacterium]
MIKRILLWLLAIAAVLAVAVALAFRFTPWPSVAIIQYVFSRGDQASEAALEKHVPANIVTRRDLAYGKGPDETLDVNYPEGTNGPLPTIVWAHGGGWIGGSKAGIANYLKVLAGHGYTTVGVEYSTGFGSTYPKPVEQVNAALGYLAGNAGALNIDPGAIVLAGDSAGAQIAAQIAIIITDPSYAGRMGISPTLDPKRLDGVLLLSGAFDMEQLDLNGRFGWFVRTVLWAYSGTRDFMNDERFALISVTHHVTSAFPPAFISSGNGDPLAPQAVALAQRLGTLGVKADSLFFPDDYTPPLPHEYQFNLDTPAGQEALARTLAFVKAWVQP